MTEGTDARQNFQPEFTNLVSLLQSAIQRHGDRPLFGVKHSDGWKWTTYREFGVLVDAFRGGLASLGVTAGDRVAVISNNRLEWVVGAHAVYSLGASYVPMYEAQLDKEWQFILEDSGAKVVLVANQGIAQRIQNLRPNLPALEVVVAMDGPASDPHSYTSLLELGRTQPRAAIVPDDRAVASLIYTSGTTGNPKGVKLSHYNLTANVLGMLKLAAVQGDDRGLSFLPWAHVFGGCVELNCAIATGGCTAICSEPTKVVEYLPEVKPTILFAVPRVWNRIYSSVQQNMATKPPLLQEVFKTAMDARSKQRRGEKLGIRETLALGFARKVIFPKILSALGGKLRFACSGAAALSREVAEFMDNLGVEVYEGYGMTETSGCTTANPHGQARLGSVGKPIPGVWIEIDKSAPGASGDEGEIIIHGSGVMQGYYNQDELTRDTLTPDGGLRSGDLGRLDADGYLYVTGRVKELYKLENGKYIAPAPLEEKITLSPYIAQSVVFGANKPHNIALIVPDLVALKAWASGKGIPSEDHDSLLAHPEVRKLLEAEVDKYSTEFKGYERISSFVIDGDELSIANGLLTPTLKLKRRQVVEKYAPVFESLYPRTESAEPAPRSSYIREIAPAPAAARAKTG